MKKHFFIISIAILLLACTKNLSVQIEYDKSIPQVQFAVEEIEKAGTAANMKFSVDKPDITINFQMDSSLDREEYVITREGKNILLRGGDANGLMYAGFDIAEAIQDGQKLTKIGEMSGKPYIANRGIKFNFPLDARTPSYDDTGDAAQNNILTMWEFDFWKNYLDNLARYRYNLLTLWSLHPYPSMVRVPGFEDVALDDVCVYTNPIHSGISRDWEGEDFENPANLKVVKKMTMDEKIKFWKNVFQYAEDRGIAIHMFHWNIYVFGTAGKYGLTSGDVHNQATLDYTRASVKQFLLTYPNIKGIGVTAGENIAIKEKGKNSITNWIWLTFGKAIKEAQEIKPEIDPVFIFRQHETNLDLIAEAFKYYGKPIDTEFKYSRARMFSTATPPWFNRIYRNTVEEHGVKIWMNVRNDDILTFRWGDPVYAQEYIKFMPKELMEGYFWGPDGYIYARVFNSKNADKLHEYEIDKQWYLFMIYGRTGYNPDLPESFYVNRIKHRFPKVDAKKLYDTWRYTSDVISWLEKIHFRQNDFEWFIEGCFDVDKFHDINLFARVPHLPDQGVMSISNFVMNGKTEGELTPFEVADKLDMASEKLLQGASQIKSGNDAELGQTLGDLTALGHLAKYYALKVRAATNLSLFRLNGTEENRSTSIQQLEQALEAWKDYAKTANTYYKPQLMSRTQMLDWDALTPLVEKDIEIVRAAKKGESIESLRSNALWERDMRHQ
jgi:hypothetical protein